MNNIIDIANKIKSAGGRLYLVGGAIRDKMLGIENHDEDYAVTGLSMDEFQRLFPNAFLRGKDFPVFDINGAEFALARRDRKIGLGHKDFDAKSDRNITIEEDLSRRDITINAIAQDVLTGEIIDPYNGIADLSNKTIRAVSSHFAEDPLRVYRVARFASKFNFDVDESTIKMMNSLKDELEALSAERVYNEFSKALLTENPRNFFDVLRKSDVLEVHFKEFYDLIGAEQPVLYHSEGDAYNHTMLVLTKVAKATRNFLNDRKLEVRFAALVHDIGKGATPKEEYPHHIGHEARGSSLLIDFSDRLKIPNRLTKCGKVSCLEHMRGGVFDKMNPAKKVKFIEDNYNTILGLDGLQIIVNADNCSGKTNANQFLKIGNEIMSKFNGDEVMKEYNIKPGIKLANKLHDLRVNYMKKIERSKRELD